MTSLNRLGDQDDCAFTRGELLRFREEADRPERVKKADRLFAELRAEAPE